jgi:SanA protein
LSSPISELDAPKKAPRKHSLFFWFCFLVLLGALLLIALPNLWVVISTHDRVYHGIDEIPPRPIGIVLGTSKKIAPEEANPHFENRLAAAAALFKAGKVRHLLVSGHRNSKYYDEPRDMTAKLVELGVPASAITPDNAGLRTLDSIVRAKEVYRLSRVTVISDDFHVPRALFIADRKGLDAIALRGESVRFKRSFKARLREYLARIKALIDLYLLDTQPANLGEPQEILVYSPD